MNERPTTPPTAPGVSKTVLLLFGAGAVILVAGMVLLYSKRAPEPPPPERPTVEPIAAPPPLVMLPPEPRAVAEPDAAPDAESGEPAAEPEKRAGGSIYGPKQGTIDPAKTNRFINDNFSQVRACYERRLKINPLLEGNLDLKIRLTPKGKVGSIGVNSDTVRDREMLDCVLRTIRGWHFPAPEDGWVVFDKSFKFQKKS
jgi:hypothetical protein